MNHSQHSSIDPALALGVYGDSANSVPRPRLIRVAIPHFCRVAGDQNQGYGSSRSDAHVLRGIALCRCLGGVLSLARSANEHLFDIAQDSLETLPYTHAGKDASPGLAIDCHVFVCGDDYLSDVLQAFAARITLHRLDLADPRHLPRLARDFLLKDEGPGEAALSLYLEDDLVIQDRLFVDKYLWFFEKTSHSFGLMPHRYELTGNYLSPRFFIDGPIDSFVLPQHQKPVRDICSGRFLNDPIVRFELAANPHSGCFVVSPAQRATILEGGVDNDGFVGPLETVATYTVLKSFPILKPAKTSRDFLLLEHAHPSFLSHRHRLMHQGE